MSNQTDFDNLVRLRVAVATGTLPRDLGQWALERAQKSIGAQQARYVWVPILRTAASLLEGSTRSRAKELAACASEFKRYPDLVFTAVYTSNDYRHHVQAAMRIDPELPSGWRQLARLIA
jgi:hypothetical protein